MEKVSIDSVSENPFKCFQMKEGNFTLVRSDPIKKTANVRFLIISWPTIKLFTPSNN